MGSVYLCIYHSIHSVRSLAKRLDYDTLDEHGVFLFECCGPPLRA